MQHLMFQHRANPLSKPFAAPPVHVLLADAHTTFQKRLDIKETELHHPATASLVPTQTSHLPTRRDRDFLPN